MSELKDLVDAASKFEDSPDEIERIFSLNEEYLGNDPDFWFEYGNMLDAAGKEESAIPLYLKALNLGIIGKLRIMTKIQLGSSLSVTGKHDEALKVLNEIFEETGDPASLMFMCLSYVRKGEGLKALQLSMNYVLSQNSGLVPAYRRALAEYMEEMPKFWEG